MTAQVQNVTITLPRDLVALTDELARETKTNRSKVISSCLGDIAQKRFHAEMEEGYRVMAEEHRQFAEITSAIAHEVVPEWKG